MEISVDLIRLAHERAFLVSPTAGTVGWFGHFGTAATQL